MGTSALKWGDSTSFGCICSPLCSPDLPDYVETNGTAVFEQICWRVSAAPTSSTPDRWSFVRPAAPLDCDSTRYPSAGPVRALVIVGIQLQQCLDCVAVNLNYFAVNRQVTHRTDKPGGHRQGNGNTDSRSGQPADGP